MGKSRNNKISTKKLIASGKKFAQRKADSLSKKAYIPGFLSRKLRRLSGKSIQRYSNRRQKIHPELLNRLEKLKFQLKDKKHFKETKELAHYAYVFDEHFYKDQLPESEAKDIQGTAEILHHYCAEGWRRGLDPSPLFETISYLSKYPHVQKNKCNPLIHFFNIGIHQNMVSMDDLHFMRKTADIKRIEEINKLNQTKILLQKKRLGVFIHIFYPELAETIANYLKNIPAIFDLFISTRENANEQIKDAFTDLENARQISVRNFENKGRDVAPFFIGFGEQLNQYDLVLKLHSKKSPHSNALSGWFFHCLDNLIGSETTTLTNLYELLKDDVGMVYPAINFALALGMAHDTCWGHSDDNFTKAKATLNSWKLSQINRSSHFNFPTGSMFWSKTEIFKPILDRKLSLDNFDMESGQIDGTFAHSLERLIGLSCTELFNKKLLTSYCGFNLSNRYAHEKSLIEGRNQLKINGFEKVIQFREDKIIPSWSLNNVADLQHLNIHWVIPHFTPGLGGHMTIFRAIDYLERCGHKCTIWVHSEMKGDRQNRLSSLHKRIIDQHFIKLKTDQIFLLGNTQEELEMVCGDVVIATDRMSTYPVLGMKKFKKRFYFVQDYEASFFARGTSTYLTDQTYASRHGFSCICASPWLKQLMVDRGNSAVSFPLAVDAEIYNKTESEGKTPSIQTIAFYVRRSTPRRLYELGVLALRALFELGDSFNIVTFGEDNLPDLGIAVKVSHAGILDPKALADLYRRSSVGLVLSGTNYSLVPNEMMACGLPVVDIDAHHTRLSYQPGTALLAEPTPQQLAMALSRLLNDQTLRSQAIEAGLNATHSLHWDQSNSVVESFIRKETETSLHSIEENTTPRAGKILVTVVIPVCNGGSFLKKVVTSCLEQELDAEFEILIIDSSSTDDCLNELPNDPRLRIHSIRRDEFGHGRTRNLGAKLARGHYVAFITQDAIPANRMWLLNLIAPLRKDPAVAAVFGSHMAHESHNQLLSHDLDQHFNRWIFRSHRQSIELDTSRQNPDASLAQHERFYSDNNSCLRKSIWKTIPFQDVVYGEDQLWAKDVLCKGFKKAYASMAIVRHSHEFSFRENVKRANTEWHFFHQYFNEKLPGTKKQVRAMLDVSCKNDRAAMELYPGITKKLLQQRRRLHFARACGYYLAAKGKGKISP